MQSLPPWQYDEFRHIGVNYADEQIAETYDTHHQRFRGDLLEEADRLLDRLDVQPSQTLIDIGCGTGSVAIQAARRGMTVYAVDVSPAMLAVAQQKVDAAGITGITFCRGGFLTYAHQGEPADVIVSIAAMHHLPDFWKGVALHRIANMLRSGGRFYLMDTVYSFAPQDHARTMSEAVAWFTEHAGASFGDEVAMAFREEFSTSDWIMEGLLARAGLRIEQAEYPNGMLAHYWCRKPSS